MNTDRLDEFYWNYMKDVKHAKMWENFYTLLHGQAATHFFLKFSSEGNSNIFFITFIRFITGSASKHMTRVDHSQTAD